MNYLYGTLELWFGVVTGVQTAREAREGGSMAVRERRHLQLVTSHLHTHTHTNQLSFTFALAVIIRDNIKQTKRTRDQNKSLSSERPNKISSGTELVLDPSEVLPNLLIATGFSGAITITLSQSTVH